MDAGCARADFRGISGIFFFQDTVTIRTAETDS